MGQRISLACFIMLFGLFSRFAYSTTTIQGLNCIFPEPANVICSGQHPGDATTGIKLHEDGVTLAAGVISGVVISSFGLGHNPPLSGWSQSDHKQSGLAAGDFLQNFSAWANYSHINTDNEHLPTMFDSSLNSGMIGVDTSPMENLIIGVAFGIDENDVDTTFNAGSQEISSFTVAPYAGYLITPFLSVDASFGYTDSDIDQTRLDSINLTSIIVGDTDSDRWFVSGNLNFFHTINRFLITAHLGVVYSEEDIDAVVESGGPDAFTSPSRTLDFGQFQIGGELAYTAWTIEPYVSIAYENNFEQEDLLLNSAQPPPSNDDDNFRIGLGARYYWSDDFSMQLNWDRQTGRSDYDSSTLSLMGRLIF